MFQIDLKSRKSIYEQVIDNLKEMIISGLLSPEEKIPSVRELSKELTVNPNTVQKAYRELEKQGFIYTASGLGSFVSDRPNTANLDMRMVNDIISELNNLIKELFYLGLTKDKISELINTALKEGGIKKW